MQCGINIVFRASSELDLYQTQTYPTLNTSTLNSVGFLLAQGSTHFDPAHRLGGAVPIPMYFGRVFGRYH
jgi:hypothetical protein